MTGDGKYDIPDSGAVFTFGRSRFADNLSSHFFIRNDPIVEISCGDEHTALVCKSGRIFLFGQNDYGQLGLGHTKMVNKPSCLKYLKPFQSTHVACGKAHTIVSTACGRLFAFGSNSEGQLGMGDLVDRVVPHMISTDLSDDDKIVALSAGCHHSAFLTDKGKLYLWGSNSDGQCGRKEDHNLLTPHQLQFENPIDSISCGYYHTAFTSLGSTYTFGEEDKGKLGCSRKISKNVPEKVDLQKHCVSVKCGGSHTMILTDEGEIYAFGSNFSGQLGIGINESECLLPKRVEFPADDEKWIYVSCGESHSALITDKGYLYTSGDARHGKLCNEDESKNHFTPIIIGLLQNYHCIFVSCGGCHTMVLAKPSSCNNEKESLNAIKEENETDENQGCPHIDDDKKNENDKSSLENSLNNTESISPIKEIYNSDIPGTENDKSDVLQSESYEDTTKSPSGTSGGQELSPLPDNDVDLVKKSNSFKKLIGAIRGKKPLWWYSNESEMSDSKNVNCQTNTENQQKSKTCSIF